MELELKAWSSIAPKKLVKEFKERSDFHVNIEPRTGCKSGNAD